MLQGVCLDEELKNNKERKCDYYKGLGVVASGGREGLLTVRRHQKETAGMLAVFDLSGSHTDIALIASVSHLMFFFLPVC